MTKTRIIILLIIVALVAAAVYFFIPKKDKTQEPKWITSAVTAQNVQQSVTATGTIEPVTEVEVGTQVSGILTTIYVDYNSEVKKGQIIAELDKSTLQLEYDSNKNNLAEAESEYEYELSNYTRIKTLHEKGLVADSDYEQNLYSYTKAKNSYETAKNNLERSKINLGYATIYSPIDGVVLTRDVEEGQTVASSYSTPTLFTIAADLTDMRVIADIDEADIGNVAVGQIVDFTVDAYPGETFSGAVVQLRPQGVVESNVVTYEVVISAANPDLKLKPGLTASVEVFVVDQYCEAVVPASALAFEPTFTTEDGSTLEEGSAPEAGMRPEGAPEGGMRPEGAPEGERKGGRPAAGETVWVKVGDKIEPRRVSVGISNGILTEVQGVVPGDSVVTGSQNITLGLPGGGSGSSNPFAPQRPGGRR